MWGVPPYSYLRPHERNPHTRPRTGPQPRPRARRGTQPPPAQDRPGQQAPAAPLRRAAAPSPRHRRLSSARVDNGRVRRVSSPVFVGRAEELAALDAALARAAGEEPAVVLLAGESGVGKSRLLAEFSTRASAAGGRVLTGECIELVEGELPYAPIVRMLRSLDPEELSELAGTGRAELSPLMPEAIEEAEPRSGEQFAQGRMFDLLLTVFGRMGESGPLVLAIEDLHWADRSTRDFLAFLVRALRSERARAGGHLPQRRASPQAPAPSPARGVRAPRSRRARGAAALLAARARGPAGGHPRGAARGWADAMPCSPGPRAIRSSPRSCWPPEAGTALCPRRFATP